MADLNKETRETAVIVEDALRNIAAQVGDIFEQSLNQTNRFSKSITNDITNNLKNLAKTSDLFEGNLSKLNKGLLSSKEVQKQIEARAVRLKSLDIQAEIATKSKVAGMGKVNKELQKSIEYEIQITKQLEEQKKAAEQQEKVAGLSGKLFKDINKIPIVGSLIDSEKVLDRIKKKSAESGASKSSVLGAGLKEAGSSILTNLFDPLTKISGIFAIIVKIAKFFIGAMFEADKRVTDIAKSFSISKDNARATYQALIDSKSVLTSNLATTKNINEAFLELVNLSDFVTQASFKQLDTQIKLTKEIGIQAEDATQLQQLFILNNEESDKGLNIVYDQIAAFANQNKVVADGRKIIAEVNKLSSLIKLNFKGSTSELVGAVLNAKKLGLNLDQVSKIGASLLDFESSISSQIEAELLTGKQINLEKARLFALNNDILGLTEEINKQGITATKFTAMNVIQQEAIAKSLGMSASELGDSLYKQELINKAGGATLKARREEIELLKAKGHLSEAQIKTRELADLEQGLITGETLEQAQASLDAQTKFNTALERAKELFSDLVTGGTLDKLSDMILGITNAFSKYGIGGLASIGSETKLATSERQLADLETQSKNNPNLSKDLKEAKEYFNKNKENASEEILTDYFQQQFDEKIKNLQDKYPNADAKTINAKDFTIKTLPEDTIVAAGGTKLGNSDELLAATQETNSYLRQLLAKDTNLYIDYDQLNIAGSKRTYSV